MLACLSDVVAASLPDLRTEPGFFKKKNPLQCLHLLPCLLCHLPLAHHHIICILLHPSLFFFFHYFVGIERQKYIWQRANGRQIGPMKVFLFMVVVGGWGWGWGGSSLADTPLNLIHYCVATLLWLHAGNWATAAAPTVLMESAGEPSREKKILNSQRPRPELLKCTPPFV